MWFIRRRSDRPDPARRGRASSLEVLEGRQLLSSFYSTPRPFAAYLPTDLAVQDPSTHKPLTLTYQHLLRHRNPQSPLLSNQGKVVSGKDRAGNEWTITVHGPGSAIVTDSTPNDGILADDIDTIQLVGTSLDRTFVTGTTKGSFRTQTDSTVLFNKLIATSGVNQVLLNGFTLTQTTTPGEDASGNPARNNSDTGIFLYGGVRTLQFHDVLAEIDPATDDPIDIIIGDPNTPLKVEPTIKIDSIFNTAIDTTSATIPTTPRTNPGVNIQVNGQLRDFYLISTTQQTVDAGQQYQFPIVGTTGRTSLRARGIDQIHVRGSAVNFTASRGRVPFSSNASGLDHLGRATFVGNADAVGLDVNGPVGRLKFRRGLGNPTGTRPSATRFGIPADRLGYPANGFRGGLVTSRRIGSLEAGPADTILLTAQNPDFVQTERQGNTTYYPQPGNAFSSAAIVSTRGIDRVAVRGNVSNSEIKTGFDYPSYAAGLEGTRSRSLIKNAAFHGDLVNGVVSSTYRPARATTSATGIYGVRGSRKGPGLIEGDLARRNTIYSDGTLTPLLNRGTGFYARVKRGALPPPRRATRLDGVQVR